MPFALIGFFLGYFWSVNKVINQVNFDQGEFASSSFTIKHDYYYLSILFMLVILCMIFARSAAMAFNRYLDRKFDAINPRTAIREIPAGVISAKSALFFTVISCALFIACTY